MIRIAITGPESSGKTTLAKDLAMIPNASLVPEFARTYLEERGGHYQQEDLLPIAKGQLEGLEQANGEVVICDSDFLVIKIWSEVKYGSVDPEIRRLYEETHFDLLVLCTPEMPWEYDPLRENPNDRDTLFDLYTAELERAGKPFIKVKGNPGERLIAVRQTLNI